MRQSRGNTDLAEESLRTNRRAELVIQHLYRDFPLVLLLFGEMNSRHSAMAKQPLDYVADGQCVDGGSRRVCHYPEYTARVQRNPPSPRHVERKGRDLTHPEGLVFLRLLAAASALSFYIVANPRDMSFVPALRANA